MALNTSQIGNLNALNEKIAGGYKASSQDLANLDYAKKQGYNYTPMAQGAIKVANPNELAGLNESQLYRSGKDIYKLPSAISSDMITGGAAPTIKTVEPSFTDTAPYVAGLDTTTKGLESLVSTALAPTPQEKNISPITSKITELTGEFQNKPIDYQTELDKYGFKTNVQDLQNLNTQIASVKAEYDKFSVGQEGRTASASSIYGRQALAQRQAAVELGGLSSMAQALQGNVQMAQSIADKTIAIKYEPVEQEIANQKFQLEQVYEQLSRDEKKKADALKITLDERQRLIDEQKTKDADINKLMVAAAGQSAPSNILQEMLKANTPQEAIVIGRDYLKTFDGYTDLGNGNYVNNITGTINTIDEIQQEQNLAQGIVTTSTGDAYDIKSYATDPNHEKSVQSILNSIGQFKTIQDVDNYIQSNYPGSKVTGQMVANAAGKYGVSWEMMVAIMAQDSGMGTKGLGSRNNNPGNIGQFDSLGKQGVKGYTTLQEGVDAVAKNLAGRKTTSVTTGTTPMESKVTPDGYDISKFTPEFYSTTYGQKVLNNEQQYNSSFLSQAPVKTFIENQTKAGSIQSIVDSGIGGPEDLALVFEFMKALDPTSVVRESEYDTASKSGNPFKQVAAKMGGYVSKGQILPEEVKQSFIKLANIKLEEQRKIYDKLTKEYRAKAYNQGLNPDNAVTDLSTFVPESNQTVETPESQYLKQLGVVTEEKNTQPQQENTGVWSWLKGMFGGPSYREQINSINKK